MIRFGLATLAVALAATSTFAQDAAKPAFGTWGIDLTSMDRNVKPGDDFYDYVNGTWQKAAVIPPDRAATGSFQDLQILSEKRMRELVDGLEARPRASLNDEEGKIRDLYDAYVDQK